MKRKQKRKCKQFARAFTPCKAEAAALCCGTWSSRRESRAVGRGRAAERRWCVSEGQERGGDGKNRTQGPHPRRHRKRCFRHPSRWLSPCPSKFSLPLTAAWRIFALGNEIYRTYRCCVWSASKPKQKQNAGNRGGFTRSSHPRARRITDPFDKIYSTTSGAISWHFRVRVP